MDQPSAKHDLTKGSGNPATGGEPKTVGTKSAQQLEKLAGEQPEGESMNINSNGDPATEKPSGSNGPEETSTPSRLDPSSDSKTKPSPKQPTAPSITENNKANAPKFPGSENSDVVAKHSTGSPDESIEAKTAAVDAEPKESATDPNAMDEDKVTNTKKPYWFARSFDRVLNDEQPESSKVNLNAIVIKMMRHDEVDKESSSGESSGGKKKGKKQHGKRSAKTSQGISSKRQRKVVRTFDVDELFDDEDLSEFVNNDVSDTKDDQAAVAEKKSSPKTKYSFEGAVASEMSRKNKTSTKSPVLSQHLFLKKSRAEIQSASALVSRSLLNGLWPSPYRSLEPARIFNRKSEEYNAHSEHMSMVGVSIETFTNDIISPAIVEEIQNCPEEKRSEPRAYLATLLYLREILVLNAATIFGPSAFLTGLEPDFSVVRSTDDNSMPVEDAAMLTVRMLATAVVIDGLSQLGVESGEKDLAEELTVYFLDTVEKYE